MGFFRGLYLSFLFLMLCCFFASAEAASVKQNRTESNQPAKLRVFVLNKAQAVVMSSTASVVDKAGIILMDAKIVRLWLEDVSYDLVVKSPSGQVFAIEHLLALNVKQDKALASLQMQGITFRESEPISPNLPYADFVRRNIELYKKRSIRLRQSEEDVIAKKAPQPYVSNVPKVPQVTEALGVEQLKDSARRMLLSLRFADAESLYNRALEMDSKDVDTMIALAQIYASTGRLQEAERMYKNSYSLSKSDLLLKRLGNLLILSEKYDSAIYNLHSFLRDNPLDASARYSLAIAYLMSGNKEDAYREYIRLRRIDIKRAEDLFDLLYR